MRVIPAIFAAVQLAAAPLVTPPPRHAEWMPRPFPLHGAVAVGAGTEAERQVARVLQIEMRRLHGVNLALPSAAPAGPAIRLALESGPTGPQFRDLRNEDAYQLSSSEKGVAIVARTPRGLLYGVQTLLQLVAGAPKSVAGARITDYPQLGFRGLHICIFPNTELAAVRQAILVAARYKYNAVVLEFWASLKSGKRPETAYEDTYSHEQVRSLVNLGRSLHMEMIPMLNSWGHASGMRVNSSQHVVLDRFPEFKPLYEEDGWSFCLANPDIYPHLFDRYGELLELFGNPRYFHLGLDEAWGHRGLLSDDRCRGADPRATLAAHLKKIHGYFAARKVRVFVWHDMFIQRDHPDLGRLSPANSVPPFNSHLVLDELPKDVIIDAWNYSETRDWPVPKHFQDRGYPVVVSPWKIRRNAVAMVNTAKNINAMGMLQTTWDSLDVTLPTVGEAGVVAWTAPGFDLGTVPYGDFLHAIRVLPICDLPRLETTLVTSPAKTRTSRPARGPGD